MHIISKLSLFISLIGVYLLLPRVAYSADCLNMHVILNNPLGYVNQNGQPTGIHWDFLDAVELRSGICLNKKLTPYARIWKSIEHGGHDGGIVFRSQDRDTLVEYVAPIFTVRTVVISKEETKISNYKDLKKLRIGKVRGIRLSKDFDTDTSLNITGLKNYEQLWMNLSRNRLDAIAGSEIGLQQTKRSILESEIVLSEPFILGERVQWLQISKKSKHLQYIPRLKLAIEELINEGAYSNLMEKHQKNNLKFIPSASINSSSSP